MISADNKNAYAGQNIESKVKNSIVERPGVIKKIREKYHIKGDLKKVFNVGIYGDKSDVRIAFTCGCYVDASIKGFKKSTGFNQLARTSVSKFCEVFELSESDRKSLENTMVSKSKNKNNPLFSKEDQQRWGNFFSKNSKKLLKWGFSNNPSREILIIYNRDTSAVKIYPMEEVLSKLSTKITFTKGGFNIGDCVSFQRKGGNGILINKKIPKTSILHPGNNVQLKLKILKMEPILDGIKLAEYSI